MPASPVALKKLPSVPGFEPRMARVLSQALQPSGTVAYYQWYNPPSLSHQDRQEVTPLDSENLTCATLCSQACVFSCAVFTFCFYRAAWNADAV